MEGERGPPATRIGRPTDADQTSDNRERVNQLQLRFNAIEDEESLQQLNASYAELRADFTEFELPETLLLALEQVQELAN